MDLKEMKNWCIENMRYMVINMKPETRQSLHMVMYTWYTHTHVKSRV